LGCNPEVIYSGRVFYAFNEKEDQMATNTSTKPGAVIPPDDANRIAEAQKKEKGW
jgi:hypothetical protein